MNKELTPLEALERMMNTLCDSCKNFVCKEKNNKSCACFFHYKLIETALKEKEQQDALIRVLKEVFEFGIINEKVIEKDDGSLSLLGQIGYTLRREISNKEKTLYRDFILKKCFPKELKALEIIKEKRVDISDLIHSKNLIDYNDGRDRKWYLTQEEFDLLKEVLL